MLSMLLLLLFVACAAALWFHGFWSNVLTLVNLIVAGLLTMNFFEPIATLVNNSAAEYTYLIDILVFWMLFMLLYGVLRTLSDLMSKEQVNFDKPVELAGRSIMAIWNAFLFVCIVCASLHTAPVSLRNRLAALKTRRPAAFSVLASIECGWRSRKAGREVR